MTEEQRDAKKRIQEIAREVGLPLVIVADHSAAESQVFIKGRPLYCNDIRLAQNGALLEARAETVYIRSQYAPPGAAWWFGETEVDLLDADRLAVAQQYGIDPKTLQRTEQGWVQIIDEHTMLEVENYAHDI